MLPGDVLDVRGEVVGALHPPAVCPAARRNDRAEGYHISPHERMESHTTRASPAL